MAFSDDRSVERSKNLTFDLEDKIIIDRKTIKRLRWLVIRCAEGLIDPQDCTVFLESLDNHLCETTVPEPQRTSQALLLLKSYRDCVPSALEVAADRLEEISKTLTVILRASELGGDQ
jgi:hypothetical protein